MTRAEQISEEATRHFAAALKGVLEDPDHAYQVAEELAPVLLQFAAPALRQQHFAEWREELLTYLAPAQTVGNQVSLSAIHKFLDNLEADHA